MGPVGDFLDLREVFFSAFFFQVVVFARYNDG